MSALGLPATGFKNIYLYARDAEGLERDWQQVGEWLSFPLPPPTRTNRSL